MPVRTADSSAPTVEWDPKLGRLRVCYTTAGKRYRREEVSSPVAVDFDTRGRVIDVDVADLPLRIADLLACYAVSRTRAVSQVGIALDLDARSLWLHLSNGHRADRICCQGSVSFAFDGEMLADVGMTLHNYAGPLR
jgi:hypothetical protein